MLQAQRRVRTVRLAAKDRDLVGRGVILLEDALRTASIPSLPGAGLIIVKSLHVGRMRRGQSPASISLTIEKQLRQTGFSVVHGADPGAESCSAVYFRDEVEPFICLAERVALHQDANAWFWRLAVPVWRPGMPLNEALRALLHASLRTSAGVMAPISMLKALNDRGVVPSLLAALRVQDGPGLLSASGWRKPPRPVPLVASPPKSQGEEGIMVTKEWLTTLSNWVNLWGADDARSLWLAASVLVAERPIRMVHPRLVQMAQASIKAVVIPPETMPLRSTMSSPPAYGASPRSRTRSEDGTPSAPDLEPRTSSEARASLQPPDPWGTSAERWGTVPGLAASEQPEIEEEVRTISHNFHALAEAPGRTFSNNLTHFAGLFFLLPVMTRLGMALHLQRHDRLIEIDFPTRLLRYIGQRFWVPEEDPVLGALSPLEPVADTSPGEFVVPEIWKQGLCDLRFLTLRRVQGQKGMRLLFDGSSRLAVAMWPGRPPLVRAHWGEGDPVREFIREFIGELPVKKGAPLALEPVLRTLLRTWMIAAHRWCRRYANMGLYNLVCRPGRVVATPTHVDVWFDHSQTDIRIRRAGLDINPGWVPWFGRVVQYRYLSEDEVYG